MNDNAELTLSRYLDPGESLLWSGIPRQGLLFRKSDIFTIPFSLVWGSFAFPLLFRDASNPNTPLPSILFGSVFAVLGFYMIFGRFIVDIARRKRTCLGLTNRRILIISGLFSRNITSLPLGSLPDLSLVEKGDRSGTINFDRPDPYQWAREFNDSDVQAERRSFEAIPNAKEVYDRILKAQSALQKSHK